MIVGGRSSRDGDLSATEIRLVAEQMWPGLAEPCFRAVAGTVASPGWEMVERHAVMGWKGRIDLIVPDSRAAAARALSSYARLRPMRRRIGRRLLAAGISAGAVRPLGTVGLEKQAGGPTPVDDATGNAIETTVHQLRAAFGEEITVAMHVRRSANRKALLQVLDRRGATLGFAKIARDAVSSAGIVNETTALEVLDGGTSTVRVPRVLLKGRSGRYPFVVTEPLPEDIRRIGPALVDTPSISEFTEICRVARWGPPRESCHVERLRERTQNLAKSADAARAHRSLDDLLQAIEGTDNEMPIGRWWHGDFAFWNSGRSRDGQLWCWDFENVEYDALAGLDAIHWHASRRRIVRGAAGVSEREGILADAAPLLQALGEGRAMAHRALYRVYIAEIAARTLEMAAADGWSRVWCTPKAIERVITVALAD